MGKERPIIFNGEMVRAILDGRKAQTRRVIKPQPPFAVEDAYVGEDGLIRWRATGEKIERVGGKPCPYGQPGDRLWVRETFSYRDYDLSQIEQIDPTIHYWADGNPSVGNWTRPKPSIHMPRWASRITLEVTGVRVERAQEISADDAMAEGIDAIGCALPRGGHIAINAFAALWDSINAKRGFGWDTNPWVWVVEFKRIATEHSKCNGAETET